ncbi:hypothetical protein Pcinc_013395 [Petrolisthes cinctipes]|uniref:Uncharacterized protein n=1 Tax=Petrolisthes cinctipes TaxID=88211 RepID=A0AAE1KQE5_PETCI|nr:hypothetical protein Pcinc_013389 [Petrolisthes cinctipes]KAK3882222.1 hypothetical protein Pcinc_013395 [Petrolisthes cinctipes]
MVWTRDTFGWSCKNSSPGDRGGKKEEGRTEEEVERQHQGVDKENIRGDPGLGARPRQGLTQPFYKSNIFPTNIRATLTWKCLSSAIETCSRIASSCTKEPKISVGETLISSEESQGNYHNLLWEQQR